METDSITWKIHFTFNAVKIKIKKSKNSQYCKYQLSRNSFAIKNKNNEINHICKYRLFPNSFISKNKSSLFYKYSLSKNSFVLKYKNKINNYKNARFNNKKIDCKLLKITRSKSNKTFNLYKNNHF